MRRALAATAVVTIVGGLLVFDVSGVPALGPDRPERQTTVPLTGARASALEPDTLVTDPMPTDDFSVMGVTWAEGSADPATTTVEVRVREADGWTGWTPLDVNDAAPDPGTEEALLAADVTATEPLVTAQADGVQVRVRSAAGEEPEDLEAVLIDPGSDAAPAAEPLSGAGAASGAPAVVTRSQWGADESKRRCSPSYSSTLLAGTVHHTAGTNSYTASQSRGIVKGIYLYHTGTLGWCDIGYNFLVDKYGTVFEGRYGGTTKAVRGAHAGGFNDRTVGVSALGNYETASAPAVMVRTIGEVLGWKLGLFGRTATGTVSLTSAGGSTARWPSGTTVTLPAVFGHRDVGLTACPGTHLYAAMGTVRSVAAQTSADVRAAAPTPTPTPSTTHAPTAPATPSPSPTPTATATPTAAPTPTPTVSTTPPAPLPVPTSAPLDADLREAIVVPLEVDLGAGQELLAYTPAAPGTRTVLDVADTGSRSVLSTTRWTLGWDLVVPAELDGTPGDETLLYDRDTGRAVVVDTSPKGESRIVLEAGWSTAWTSIVPVEVDGNPVSELLLYSATTGAQRVVRLSPVASSATFGTSTWSRGWTSVTALEADGTAGAEVGVYNAATGRHAVVDLGTGRLSTTLSSQQWASGLSTVVGLEVDGTERSEVLTYDAATGTGTLLDVAAGAALVRRTGYRWDAGWSTLSPAEVDRTAGAELVLHDRTSGRLLLLDLAANGTARQLGWSGTAARTDGPRYRDPVVRAR
ncbi:peptidoglycan recognition protein [Aquipuribacter nitratireducens]|uniref:Peptidoglycan recognition protein n=1 Tax=Aquipuribacter nitratireducens TaxID=650104 RepID=A0ABW0GJN5_9MICO